MRIFVYATPSNSVWKLWAIAGVCDNAQVHSEFWPYKLWIDIDEKDKQAVIELIEEAELEIAGKEK